MGNFWCFAYRCYIIYWRKSPFVLCLPCCWDITWFMKVPEDYLLIKRVLYIIIALLCVNCCSFFLLNNHRFHSLWNVIFCIWEFCFWCCNFYSLSLNNFSVPQFVCSLISWQHTCIFYRVHIFIQPTITRVVSRWWLAWNSSHI